MNQHFLSFFSALISFVFCAATQASTPAESLWEKAPIDKLLNVRKTNITPTKAVLPEPSNQEQQPAPHPQVTPPATLPVTSPLFFDQALLAHVQQRLQPSGNIYIQNFYGPIYMLPSQQPQQQKVILPQRTVHELGIDAEKEATIRKLIEIEKSVSKTPPAQISRNDDDEDSVTVDEEEAATSTTTTTTITTDSQKIFHDLGIDAEQQATIRKLIQQDTQLSEIPEKVGITSRAPIYIMIYMDEQLRSLCHKNLPDFLYLNKKEQKEIVEYFLQKGHTIGRIAKIVQIKSHSTIPRLVEEDKKLLSLWEMNLLKYKEHPEQRPKNLTSRLINRALATVEKCKLESDTSEEDTRLSLKRRKIELSKDSSSKSSPAQILRSEDDERAVSSTSTTTTTDSQQKL